MKISIRSTENQNQRINLVIGKDFIVRTAEGEDTLVKGSSRADAIQQIEAAWGNTPEFDLQIKA